MSTDFWLNPTSVNGGNAVQWNNLTMGQKVLGAYLAIRTNVSGETKHRYLRLPVALDDGFGAVFFQEEVLFDFDVTKDGNYLIGYSYVALKHAFELSDTQTVNLNGYYSSLFSSSNMFVVSGQTVDGTTFTMGTTLRLRR